MEQPQIQRHASRKQKPQRPKSAKVVIYNDDETTFEFVINMLMDVFFMEKDAAEALTAEIDQRGHAVAGVYPYDIAKSKAETATDLARQAGFPLRIEVETV